jgi:hypothetical protein
MFQFAAQLDDSVSGGFNADRGYFMGPSRNDHHPYTEQNVGEVWGDKRFEYQCAVTSSLGNAPQPERRMNVLRRGSQHPRGVVDASDIPSTR